MAEKLKNQLELRKSLSHGFEMHRQARALCASGRDIERQELAKALATFEAKNMESRLNQKVYGEN